MLKSPNEVLQHFIDALNKETELLFAMDDWYYNPVSGTDTKPSEVKNVCGTSACLAGTVAFQLEPKSKVKCTTVIMKWVGIEVDDVWGDPVDDATSEEIACDGVFNNLFTQCDLYGEYVALMEVSKEDVLSTLTSLVSENHSTWKSVQDSTEATIRSNR